jgi:hypothetical protein
VNDLIGCAIGLFTWVFLRGDTGHVYGRGLGSGGKRRRGGWGHPSEDPARAASGPVAQTPRRPICPSWWRRSSDRMGSLSWSLVAVVAGPTPGGTQGRPTAGTDQRAGAGVGLVAVPECARSLAECPSSSDDARDFLDSWGFVLAWEWSCSSCQRASGELLGSVDQSRAVLSR